VSENAVRQRASLERRLHELPALRAAMRDDRVTYEKARIVAGRADEDSLGGWIERAERLLAERNTVQKRVLARDRGTAAATILPTSPASARSSPSRGPRRVGPGLREGAESAALELPRGRGPHSRNDCVPIAK
jgi:hypothetical protein